MSIINPHDMSRHYVLWGFSLGLVAVMAGLLYSFHPQSLLVHDVVPEVVKPVAAVSAGILGLLAVSFKFVFSQELVAWTLLDAMAVLGTILVGLFGYSEWWLIYHVVAFTGLFIFGPYLHFE
ncbi:MAG: hypothetical protein HY565_04660 [Candidatus Kerfeldbacteria bacterium]|nr:hypothetical protein [Candidatus Kerfeldbacteria bacterium]